MHKSKQIVISLCISLALLIVFNIVYKSIKKEDTVNVYLLKENLVKGELIEKDKLVQTTIAKGKLDDNSIVTDYSQKLYAKYDLKVGQILIQDLVEKLEMEEDTGYEYVSIPIETPHDALGYAINKGSIINVYYTAKLVDVSDLLTNITGQVYSAKGENMVTTAKLFDNIGVVQKVNNSGIDDTVFSQIIIRVKKEDVSKLICLKQFGTFTLSLIE